MASFRGVFANLPTALTADGEAFDEGRMRAHVEWLIDEGVHGLSCLLSSGEFAYLSESERQAVARCVLRAADGRVPVLVGASSRSTAATIEMARQAEALGASAVMVLPLSYFRLREDEVLKHYEAVLRAVDIPVGIYNNPATTGVDITADLYARIAGLGRAELSKDSSGDLFRAAAVRARCGDSFAYLIGTEYLVLPALEIGAAGCCIAIASVLPKAILEIYRYAVTEPDVHRARAAYDRLLPVLSLYREEGVCRSVKATADLVGRPLGPHRAPLQPLRPEARERLRRALSDLGAV